MLPQYKIHEVDGVAFADVINEFNSYVEEWPLLQERHFTAGYWWIVYLDTEPVAFAGLVPFDPCLHVGYCKRCYVKPDHHGHGLQFRMLMAREKKARELGWTMIVSECGENNLWSASNFRKAGYIEFEPEQPWAKEPSIYFKKEIRYGD
jgi:GNAT superfamily N-acetyltransferase